MELTLLMATPSRSNVKTQWVGGHHPCEKLGDVSKPVKKHLQTKSKENYKKPGTKRRSGVDVKLVAGTKTTIVQHCEVLIKKYGSIRATVLTLDISMSYFRRLIDGKVDYPSDEVVEKLGLKRTIIYEVQE